MGNDIEFFGCTEVHMMCGGFLEMTDHVKCVAVNGLASSVFCCFHVLCK